MFRSYQNWTVKLFQEIVAAVQALVSSYNPQINGKNVAMSFSSSHAKELWNAGNQNEKIRLQNNPLTADSITKQPYGTLEEWGFAKLGRKPFTEGRGEYIVEFTGTGGIYEAGFKFVNQNTGFTYTLKEKVVINSGSEFEGITFSSITNFGGINIRFTESNEFGITTGVVIADLGGIPTALKPGDFLSSTQILAGVDNPSKVIEVLVDPTNAETITEYKEDTLQAYRIPPRGGARGDYTLWGEEVSGVKRVYHYAGGPDDVLGAQWVVIESTVGDGFASAELIDIVTRHLDSKITLPEPGIVIESVVVTKLTVTIEGLFGVATEDLNAMEASVISTVENYFKSVRPFIDGVDRSTTKNDTLKRAELVAVIIDAVGIYGGVISDSYWNPSQRQLETEQNEIFRPSNIVYI